MTCGTNVRPARRHRSEEGGAGAAPARPHSPAPPAQPARQLLACALAAAPACLAVPGTSWADTTTLTTDVGRSAARQRRPALPRPRARALHRPHHADGLHLRRPRHVRHRRGRPRRPPQRHRRVRQGGGFADCTGFTGRLVYVGTLGGLAAGFDAQQPAAGRPLLPRRQRGHAAAALLGPGRQRRPGPDDDRGVLVAAGRPGPDAGAGADHHRASGQRRPRRPPQPSASSPTTSTARARAGDRRPQPWAPAPRPDPADRPAHPGPTPEPRTPASATGAGDHRWRPRWVSRSAPATARSLPVALVPSASWRRRRRPARRASSGSWPPGSAPASPTPPSTISTAAAPALEGAAYTSLMILPLVLLFLLVQRVIDRRDPKLALAPSYGDPFLGFVDRQPPHRPSGRRHDDRPSPLTRGWCLWRTGSATCSSCASRWSAPILLATAIDPDAVDALAASSPGRSARPTWC